MCDQMCLKVFNCKSMYYKINISSIQNKCKGDMDAVMTFAQVKRHAVAKSAQECNKRC